MRIYKITEIKKMLPSLLFAITASVLVLVFPKSTINGAIKGINFCLNVLVPSLFPFMVISSFIVSSGIYKLLSKPLNVITKVLFNLPGKCGTTILLSLIGGYPVGARGIESLYSKGVISNKQAEKMAYFCVCSGPGFLITFVGSTLYGNSQVGLIILISAVLSVIACGVITRFFGNSDKSVDNNSNLEFNATLDFSYSLIKSVKDATKATVDMCAMVVLFNVLINFLEIAIQNESIKNLSYILFEVTTACNTLAGNVSLTIIAFAVGFGGLCVHFQVFQGLNGIKINKVIFFFFRIIQGVLTALFTKTILYFFPITEQVFYNTQNKTVAFSSSSYLGSLMLLITAVCFLYSLKTLNNNTGG